MYFDIDAHKDCFKTNGDETYFWHGQTNHIGDKDIANSIADLNKGKTLEMCMLDNIDELENAGVRFKFNDDDTVTISYGSNQSEANQFWDDCSKSFAEQATGNIYVIEGTDPRPNGQSEGDYPSVYNRIERPTLEQNPNITSITYINPANGETTGVESLSGNKNTTRGHLPTVEDNPPEKSSVTRGHTDNEPSKNIVQPSIHTDSLDKTQGNEIASVSKPVGMGQ